MKTGHLKSCGCARQRTTFELCCRRDAGLDAAKLKAGERFGRLTVIEDNGMTIYGGHRRSIVKTRCDCGEEVFKLRTNLLHGKVKSCGCLRQEIMAKIGSLGLNRKPFGHAAKHATFDVCRRRAERRGIAFCLTETEFLSITSLNCFYCGSPPANVSKSGVYNGDYVYNGIDRVNSELGYVVGNCVPACIICNRAKSDLPLEEFLRWLTQARRPQGELILEKLTDGFGKDIPFDDARRYGWLKELEVYKYQEDTHNLFVDQGRQLLAYAFGFRAPIENYTVQKFAVGTGLTAARVTDVALESAVALASGFGATVAKITSVDFLTAFVMRVGFNVAVGDANGYLLTEFGLFSGNDTLLARKVRSVGINKTSDFSLTLTWRIRF